MATVREAIREYSESKNYSFETDRDLIEVLYDWGDLVQEGSRDEHRWYIVEDIVIKLGERYIDTYRYIITGDNCMRDMGLEYDLDEMAVVYPKERQITEIYYTADK